MSMGQSAIDHHAGTKRLVAGSNNVRPQGESSRQSRRSSLVGSWLRSELIRLKVMLDALGSHCSGTRPLSDTTSAFVFGGLAIVAVIIVFSLTAQMLVLLLGVPVLAVLIATLGGEVESYIDWRVARDPSYEPKRREFVQPRTGENDARTPLRALSGDLGNINSEKGPRQ